MRKKMWERACVGAGLPAMQTPRFFSHAEVMLSQASQLPHWFLRLAGYFQRSAAAWSLLRPSTQRGPSLVFSFFQNGARVFK